MASRGALNLAVSSTWEEMDDGTLELWYSAVAQLRLAYGHKLVPAEHRRWLAQLLTHFSEEEEEPP